jgi:hypothetical protein
VSVARKARRHARSPWVEWLGRGGLVAIGVSYGVVAVLALLVAFHAGGRTTDRTGALHVLAGHVLGKILLVLLACGFAGYALWRYAQSLFDRGGRGDDAEGLAKRAAALGKALLYSALCIETVGILVGGGGGGGGNKERGVAGWALRHTGGRLAVGAVGLAVLAAGGWNLYRAVSRKFREQLVEHEMGGTESRWATRLGVFGFGARGVVFALIGIFVVSAAWDYDPKKAIGLDGALADLARQAYGDWLLGVVAAGLLAFALFCLVQARYREV